MLVAASPSGPSAHACSHRPPPFDDRWPRPATPPPAAAQISQPHTPMRQLPGHPRPRSAFHTLRRAFVLVALVALSALALPAPATPAPARPAAPPHAFTLPAHPDVDLRVRLLAAARHASIDAPAGLNVGLADDPSPRHRLRGPLRIERRAVAAGPAAPSAAVWVLHTPDPRAQPILITASPTSVLRVRPAGPADQRAFTLNGNTHPGEVLLIPRADADPRAFDLVESVPLEHYLPGVVGKEMPRGWPAAAYQAQAIAARSYALHERARRRALNEPFDLESTEDDQVYAGNPAFDDARRAVDATRGRVLTWNGLLLRAYYSSTCGGRPASAADVWPAGPALAFNADPPLQAAPREHACHDAPRYRWTIERPRDETEQRLRAFGQSAGKLVRQARTLHAVAPLERNPADRPIEYRITEPGGRWFRLSAASFRAALNAPAPNLPPPTRQERAHSGDFELAVHGPRVRLLGRGLGHGVGMCQWCARGFAQRGESAERMLQRFYPGAQLQTIPDPRRAP